jgi:hypothetical protein
MRKLVLVLAVCAVALAFPGVASAGTIVNVTSCATPDIQPGVHAVLQQDLSCQIGLYLLNNASFDLNGHTFTLVNPTSFGGPGVTCVAKCTVYGGTMIDARTNGEDNLLSTGSSTTVHDAVLQSTGGNAIFFIASNVKLTNVTATAPAVNIEAGKKLTVMHSSFDYTGFVPGQSNTCLQATWFKASIVATDVHLQGCDIYAFGNVTGKLVTVTGSPDWGISTRAKLKLTDSTITGNPVDISAGSMPKLVATTCGTSAESNLNTGQPVPGSTWEVCTNDGP